MMSILNDFAPGYDCLIKMKDELTTLTVESLLSGSKYQLDLCKWKKLGIIA